MSADNPVSGSAAPAQLDANELRRLLIKCHKTQARLVAWIQDLVALGEPPYNFAVFVSFSELDVDALRKKNMKQVFGIDVDFKKCYLMLPGVNTVMGTVSLSLAAKLRSGQLVLISGNYVIVAIVPEAEIQLLPGVSEGIVDRVLGELVIVSDARGFRGNGVVLDPRLKEELAGKPLEEGDKVLLFGPCVLKVLERVSGKRAKVKMRPTTFADIGGLEDEIQEIRDVMGLDFAEESKRAIKMETGRGVVLYGPPGVGKTMIVRAIANELGYYFILVNGADFESMWVGESQKQLRARLDEALKNKPAIIFFDEVETAFPVRGAAIGLEHKNDNLAAFNTFMDGVEDTSGVFVVFGSNRIDKVDPAVIRSGRMSKKIYIPRPNREGARSILRIYLPCHPVGESGDREEIITGWINRLLDEIFSVRESAHLFTAFSGNESRKYYFRSFISGSLLKGMVDEAVLRALKRLKATDVRPGDPAFGVITEDFKGVVHYMVRQEIPPDDRSRNEWLTTNGYPQADEFRDGKAMKSGKS